MKVIIVDDEPLALDVLETYINQIPELDLVGKFSNAIDANKRISEGDIDVAFMDIQMPQLTGIELLKSLKNPPNVIFTTAYPEYAVEGFELDATDYLLKPISFERFLKAVNKLNEQQKSSIALPSAEDYFFVKADKKLIKVFYSDILYIEGLKDYVMIKKNDGRIVSLQTMKSLEAKLPSDKFKRVHRSFILNLERINAIVGNSVELTEKGSVKHIPIGKNYKDELLAIVNEKRL